MGIVQFVLGLVATYFLVVVLYYVGSCIFRMIQFGKAGVQGTWKAWIPFYWNYIEFDLYYKKEYFWVWLALVVLAGVFSKSDALTTIFNLAQAVLMVLLFYNKAKSYGKGGGFTAGLVLLNIIFEGILALGPAEYQGNASQGIAFVDQGIDKVKELFGGKKEE